MIPAAQKGDALLADIHTASADPSQLHLWWLGQSGFLIKWSGHYLLLDPYLSDSLTHKYAATDKPHQRMTEQCIRPEQLHFVQLVTSSHQHTDHFDEATLGPLSEAAGGIECILPTATLAAAMQRLPDAKISWLGLDAAQELSDGTWHITGIPAAHNEVEKDAEGRCKYLGFLIRVAGFTLYHSGDTLWHEGLVPALLEARCDLALLPINGHEPSRRVAGNMNGTEAAALAKAIGAKLAVPHHFEGFAFNTASPEEFTSTCTRLKQPHQVMRCGERLTLRR